MLVCRFRLENTELATRFFLFSVFLFSFYQFQATCFLYPCNQTLAKRHPDYFLGLGSYGFLSGFSTPHPNRSFRSPRGYELNQSVLKMNPL